MKIEDVKVGMRVRVQERKIGPDRRRCPDGGIVGVVEEISAFVEAGHADVLVGRTWFSSARLEAV